MALFLRKRPPERCHPAEVEVAEFLADLDDDWLVRWGFNYRDDRGAWREGDFMVSSPTGGLLVLEVKSGSLVLNPYTGVWNTAGGDDPMIQLDAQWSAIMRDIAEHVGGRPSVYVGRALGTPHLSLSPGVTKHHGIPREFIFDRKDLRDFAATFGQRMRAWGARIQRTDREVFEAACGGEGTAKAVRHFVDDVDRTILRHTEARHEILDQLAENRRFIVSGGAGTGKTWLAVELARRWALEGQRVLLLAYNLGFTGELRALIERMTAQRRITRGSISVMGWEDLVRDLFAEAGLPFDPPDEREARRRFFEDEVPGLMGDILAGGSINARFDALVVDEGQDHDTANPAMTCQGGWWPSYFLLLQQGRGAPVAVFHDASQRPSFRAGTFDLGTLLSVWGGDPVRVRLGQSLRYTQQIYQYLKNLSSPELQSLQAGLGVQPSWSLGIDVQQVEAAAGETADAVAEIVAHWVGQGWAKPEQILIASRRSTLDGSSLRAATQLAGFPLVQGFQPPRGSLGFGSVNRAKGLDRLGVIVVDFAPWKGMPAQDHVPFFLGASRARQLLAVVGMKTVAPAGAVAPP